jgi:hypothetical protein
MLEREASNEITSTPTYQALSYALNSEDDLALSYIPNVDTVTQIGTLHWTHINAKRFGTIDQQDAIEKFAYVERIKYKLLRRATKHGHLSMSTWALNLPLRTQKTGEIMRNQNTHPGTELTP